eukprot:SAG31_NODE_1288_length_8994_cov_4.105003_3_plen_65_part_00
MADIKSYWTPRWAHAVRAATVAMLSNSSRGAAAAQTVQRWGFGRAVLEQMRARDDAVASLDVDR